jgi:hypothetical protein
MKNSVDKRSVHAGCPVKSGEKWAINFWFWNRELSLSHHDTKPIVDNQSFHDEL